MCLKLNCTLGCTDSLPLSPIVLFNPINWGNDTFTFGLYELVLSNIFMKIHPVIVLLLQHFFECLRYEYDHIIKKLQLNRKGRCFWLYKDFCITDVTCGEFMLHKSMGQRCVCVCVWGGGLRRESPQLRCYDLVTHGNAVQTQSLVIIGQLHNYLVCSESQVCRMSIDNFFEVFCRTKGNS